MYDLCQALGVDYDRMVEAAAADKRIGRTHLNIFHKGGRGYGGKCLPKDIKALIQLANTKGIDLKLHKTADLINEELMRAQGIDDPEKKGLRKGF
jgi:UDP-glucose 6-dehydrogenase